MSGLYSFSTESFAMSFTQVSLSYDKCLLKAALRMNDISAVRMVPKRLRKTYFSHF